MNEFSGQVSAPVLAKLAALLRSIAQLDAPLREIQSRNAPAGSYMGNGTPGDNSGTSATLTDAAIIDIPEARSGQETFYSCSVMFQSTAGSGRYTVNGTPPKATGTGLPIPSGGGQLTISGMDNIRKFRMIAETGQTLNFVYQLFK